MTAPLSAHSLAQNFSQRFAVPSASSALLGIPGLGAQPDSFSQTLQRQMNTPARPPEPPPARQAEREPEPSRPAPAAQTPAQGPAEPTRQPERSSEPCANDGTTDKPAGTGAQPDQRPADGSTAERSADASSKANGRPDETTAQGEAGAAAAAAAAASNSASGVDSVVSGVESLVLQAAETPVDTPEAAALAGLPAALAALLAGTKQAETDEGVTTPTLASAAGERKSPQDARSLQNSALLPKTETLAEGSNRNAATPSFLVQGRTLAAGVLADKGMAAAQALKAVSGEAGGAGAQQPNALLSTHAPLHLLRHAPTTQPATPQLPVHTPAGQQAWAEDVGNQVRWMLGRAESKAELVLTPPNLGKLEVSINLNGDQTTAQFVASSQAARDALERAMPQLREILQQAGISLGEANVSTSDQGAREDGGTAGRGRGDATGSAGSEGGIAGGGASGWIRQHDGMVDTFA